MGKVLYDEQPLELRRFLRTFRDFYLVGFAVLGLALWLVLNGVVLVGILAITGIAALLVGQSLLAPLPARISTDGIALPVSTWDRIARRRRRWIAQNRIERISPLIALRDDGLRIYAYEIDYAGKLELFPVTPSSEPSSENPPLSALQEMVGNRWNSVFRKVPPMTSARAAWLQHHLERPLLDKERKTYLSKVLAFTGVGAAALASYFSFILHFSIGVYSGATGMGISFAAGAWAMSSLGSAEHEQIRAYWFLLQMREAKMKGEVESIENVPTHPDFICVDLRAPEQQREARYLQSVVRRWWDGWLGILLGFGTLFLALVVSTYLLDLSLLSTLATWGIAGMLFAILARGGWKELQEAWGARVRTMELLREEWKTNARVLPPDFEIPDSVGIFRGPEKLTESMLRKMHIAAQVDSSRLVLVAAPGGLAVSFGLWFIADLVFRNRPLAFLAIFGALGWAAIWGVVFVATNRGRSLLGCARVFEEATGRTVLPGEDTHRLRSPR